MRHVSLALLVVTLTLSGCVELAGPVLERSQQFVSISRGAPLAKPATFPDLRTSVEVNPRVGEAGGILVATLSLTNHEKEAIVLPVTVPSSCLLELSIFDVRGNRVKEYCVGMVAAPLTLQARETIRAAVELPAPSDPGLYRFRVALSGSRYTSAPFVVRVIE